MNHKSPSRAQSLRDCPFKQFAKDCPKHFSEDVLLHSHLENQSSIKFIQNEKSTRNSTIRNKF